jgi:hypothetical protein
MAADPVSTMQRRDFLKLTGAMTALSLTHRALAGPSRRISVIVDANDSIASSDPVKWAAGQLRKALLAKGVICEIVQSPEQAKGPAFCVLVARRRLTPGQRFPASRRGAHKPGEYPLDSRTPGGNARHLGLCEPAPEASSTGSSN